MLTIAGEVDPITGEIVGPKSIRSAVKHNLTYGVCRYGGPQLSRHSTTLFFPSSSCSMQGERVEEANYKYYLSTAATAVIVNSENPLLEVTDEILYGSTLMAPYLALTNKVML